MKDRQPNFEILRIVSMLAVVIAHYLVWGTNQCGGPLLVGFQNGGINSFIYPFLHAFTPMGVLCFVLTTSYFISGSRVLRLDRILKVWAPTLFYSVVMVFVSSLFVNISHKDILKSLVPIGTGQYWFVTKYIALVLLAPLLSIIVEAVSRKGLQIILTILAFLTITITCGIPYGNQFFGDNPLSVSSFVFVFFIASYIRKYDIHPWVAKHSGWIFIAAILLQGVGGIILNLLRQPADLIYGAFSSDYNAFSIVPATALFIWFKNHDFKDNLLTRLLCKLAPYTFATYLIHDNPHFRMILWRNIFNPGNWWQTPFWGIFALTIPVAVLLASCMIDIVRGKLFCICRFDKLVNKVRRLNITIE